jgi:hypothetical protein
MNRTLRFIAVLLLHTILHAQQPTLTDFWEGRALFSVAAESLNTDTRSGLHFLADVPQPDGTYWVYYIHNEGSVPLSGSDFPLQTVGLAMTRDWRTFKDLGRVLPRGGHGTFDARIASFADVLKDGSTYHMVYEGAGTSSAYPGDVAYATSSDGIRWTKHGIILKHSGRWESANNGTPSLFKEGNTWYLFYHGFDGRDVRVFGASGPALTRLKRLNGGRPLVDTSAAGWDAGTVGKRSIVKQGGYYWMIYEGSADQPFDRARWSSGLARSRDLLAWEKWKGTGGPVLPLTGGGTDSFGFDGPEWVFTPDQKLSIFFRQPGNTTGRATLVWNRTPPRERLFEAERDLQHRVGRREADGWSAAPARDGAGFLTFGPYVTDIAPGARTATWRLLIDNPAIGGSRDTVATLDCHDAQSGRLLTQRSILRRDFVRNGAYQEFALPFNAELGQRLEFRLWWHDRTYLRQDWVRVR